MGSHKHPAKCHSDHPHIKNKETKAQKDKEERERGRNREAQFNNNGETTVEFWEQGGNVHL